MKVFINCPFDEDYDRMRNRILFVLLWADLEPMLASDFGNKNESRFSRICKMLQDCPVSIHDLSRNKCNCGSTKKPKEKTGAESEEKKKRKKADAEHYRLNMPLELGYAMACVDLSKGKQGEEKRIFIMANHRADVLIAANDINNYDPVYHGDEVHKVTSIIRNFIIQEILEEHDDFPEGHTLEKAYMEFEAGLIDPMITTTEIKKKIKRFISKEKENILENEKESNTSPSKET